MKRLAAIVLPLLLPSFCLAQQQQPFKPPAGFALFTNFAGTGKTLDGATSPNANWTVIVSAQPGSIGAFGPPVQTSPGQWSSRAAWGELDVDATTQPQTVTISQDGSAHACATPSGGISEYDMDVSPDRKAVDHSIAASKKDFPPLSALSSLNLTGTLKINAAGPASGVTPCTINHANLHISAEFIDEAVQPPQMLWYGINVARVCEPNPIDTAATLRDDTQYQNCLANPPGLTWFWNGRRTGKLVNYGVSEPIQAYGGNVTPGSRPVSLSLDLLPHIEALITSGRSGIDPNLQDWRLAATNYGQALWGNTVLSTTWQGFIPTWTLTR